MLCVLLVQVYLLTYCILANHEIKYQLGTYSPLEFNSRTIRQYLTNFVGLNEFQIVILFRWGQCL